MRRFLTLGHLAGAAALVTAAAWLLTPAAAVAADRTVLLEEFTHIG